MTSSKTNRRIYWAAWPLLGDTEYFPTKREATEHVARRGGGHIRKFRQECGSCSTRTDSIEVAAR